MVKEFVDMFYTDLSGVPRNLDINFGSNLEPNNKIISIPPYKMA